MDHPIEILIAMHTDLLCMSLDNVNDFITNQRKRTIDVSWFIIIMWCYLWDVVFDISTDKF